MSNLKWSFADSHTRIEDGGWARQTTIRELPTSKELAGVNMRLEEGAIRELHWHKEVCKVAHGHGSEDLVDACMRSRQNGHMCLKATYESQHWTLKAGTTLPMSRREICGISRPDTLIRFKALVPAAASFSSSLTTATSAKTLPFYFQTGLVGHPHRPENITKQQLTPDSPHPSLSPFQKLPPPPQHI